MQVDDTCSASTPAPATIVKVEFGVCLLCSSPEGMSLESWRAYEVSSVDSSNNNPLSSNLWAIFIVRRLLNISKEGCNRLLRKMGGVGPSKWFTMCSTCSPIVQQAFELHRQILHLEDQLVKLRTQAVEVVLSSMTQGHGGDGERREVEGVSVFCPREEIRRLCTSSKSQFIPDPLIKGVNEDVEMAQVVMPDGVGRDLNDLNMDLQDESNEAQRGSSSHDDREASKTTVPSTPAISKRGRGRPRKPVVYADMLQEDDNHEDDLYVPYGFESSFGERNEAQRRMSVAHSDGRDQTSKTPVSSTPAITKRGRGRPRKTVVNAEMCLQDSGPETITDALESSFDEINDVQRGSIVTNSEERNQVSQTAVHSTPAITKRGRGRPKKVVNTEMCLQDSAPETITDEDDEDLYEEDTDDYDDDDDEWTTQKSRKKGHSSKSVSKQKSSKVKAPKVSGEQNVDSTLPQGGTCRRGVGRPKRSRMTVRFSDAEVATPDAEFPGGPLQICTICDEMFTLDFMDEHLRRHEKYKNTTCKICNFPAKSESFLESHHKKVHEPKKKYIFNCKKCKFVTRLPTRSVTHKKQHAALDNVVQEDDKWKCKICGDLFPTRLDGNLHLRAKHGERVGLQEYKCTQCDYASLTSDQLNVHILAKHERTHRHFCEICGSGFFQTFHLQNHMKAFHLNMKDERSVLCDICGKSFMRRVNMREHRKFHFFTKEQRKQHALKKCVHCDVMLPYSSARDKHMRSVHAELYKFNCDQCPATYSRITELLKHQKQKHVRQQQQ